MVSELTDYLQRWRAGEASARDALLTLVYDDLRSRAHGLVVNDRTPVIDPTELVNEAFFKLAGLHSVSWQDRNHFMAVASTVMRQVLTDLYRRRNAQKRAREDITLETHHLNPHETPVVFDDLNAALSELQRLDPALAQVTELKFFGGMTNEEISDHLQQPISRTKRNWRVARAWLLTRLREDAPAKRDP